MSLADAPYMHQDAGLFFGVMKKVKCPNCGPVIVNNEDRSCMACAWEYSREWGSADEEGFAAYLESNWGRDSRGNEFNGGFDMFMLPKHGEHKHDHESRRAYSVHDFEQKLRKTNVNQDGVTTWDGQPPRYLGPEEKSQW